MAKQKIEDEPDRDVETVARLLVERNPRSWLLLIELVHVTEIVSLARAALESFAPSDERRALARRPDLGHRWEPASVPGTMRCVRCDAYDTDPPRPCGPP